MHKIEIQGWGRATKKNWLWLWGMSADTRRVRRNLQHLADEVAGGTRCRQGRHMRKNTHEKPGEN
jgi:hypothetical protein